MAMWGIGMRYATTPRREGTRPKMGRSNGFGPVAYVEPALATPGVKLEVSILGDPRAAQVVAAPLYDAGNARLRA